MRTASRLFIISLVCLVLLSSCSTTSCKIEDRAVPATESNEKSMTTKKDLTNRIRVYKADGSQQCGTSKKIDLNTMQKELETIQVFSAENKHDGLMRIQIAERLGGLVPLPKTEIEYLYELRKKIGDVLL